MLEKGVPDKKSDLQILFIDTITDRSINLIGVSLAKTEIQAEPKSQLLSRNLLLDFDSTRSVMQVSEKKRKKAVTKKTAAQVF